MRLRRLLLSGVACAVCAAWAVAPARAQSAPFDPKMSLEETLAWLGKQITRWRSTASPDGKYVRREGLGSVKAKGCSLGYIVTRETESRDPVTPTSPTYQTREVWSLDLSRLDPESIRARDAHVRFTAAPDARNAIRVTVFGQARPSGSANDNWVSLAVRDGADAGEVAAGLKHAVELCRQRKQ